MNEDRFEIVEISRKCIFSKIPTRKEDSHKGDFGKLLNISGSSEYMGAPILSTLAAMRCGAGYVILASTKRVCDSSADQLIECVMYPLEENNSGTISFMEVDKILKKIEKCDAVTIGSGLGINNETINIVYNIIEKSQKPIVIDADGLNAISKNQEILLNKKAPIILTPHLMELSRLIGIDIEELKKDKIGHALEFAKKYNVIIVVKGHPTYIVFPDNKVFKNSTGNSGMAKAGSGDVLTGLIGSFIVQGLSEGDAVLCGVYIHGLAGDYAAERLSKHFMLPRDIINSLSKVFIEIEKSK